MKKTLIAGVTALFLVSSVAAYAADWALPNAATPGALNPAVTQANIATTVCKSGWTDTIRPPVSYTNKLKAAQLAKGGAYESFPAIYGAAAANYEEDHLISLQLGGSPTDPKNLWPEPYAGSNARKKDVIETALKRLVCSGKMTLAAAQKAISTNWVTAYKVDVTPIDVKNVQSNG